MATPVPHRPPRHPGLPFWLFGASQLLVGLAWWQLGWRIGLPLMLASHLLVLWGVLWPRSALFAPVLHGMPTRERDVWLTIDDGPSGDTRRILDLLDVYGARATFFVVGERALERPEDVREIVRRGHGIGNHSMSHPSGTFWALGPRALDRQVAQAQEAITRVCGVLPCWFRAVVGMANPFLSLALKRHGLARVAWNARGFDAVRPDPGIVVDRVMRGLRPGAIILMHEGAAHGRNVEAMGLLLSSLSAAGYRCVLPRPLGSGSTGRDDQPVVERGPAV